MVRKDRDTDRKEMTRKNYPIIVDTDRCEIRYQAHGMLDNELFYESSRKQNSTKEKRKKRGKAFPKTDTQQDFYSNRFILFYNRGDLPVCICKIYCFNKFLAHGARRKLIWKIGLETVDYEYYLPLFFNGLAIEQEPYSFISYQGSKSMIRFIHLHSQLHQILARALKHIISGLRAALSSNKPNVVCKAVLLLQQIIKIKSIPQYLQKFYYKILPPMNMHLILKKRQSKLHEFSKKPRGLSSNVLELIEETIGMMEVSGGKFAEQQIKTRVPTFYVFRGCSYNTSRR